VAVHLVDFKKRGNMSVISRASILYDINNKPICVVDNDCIDEYQSGLVVVGKNSDGYATCLRTNEDGYMLNVVRVVDEYGGSVYIHENNILDSNTAGLPFIGKNDNSKALIARLTNDGYLHTVTELIDENRNKVGIIYDSGNDVSGATYRLQVESDIKPGASINVGAPLPSNPTLLYTIFLKDSIGSENLLVNGSSTPVEFSVDADSTQDITLNELRFVFSTDDMTFDGESFGPNIALTNGIKIDITVNNGDYAELINIKINEDFLRFVSSAGINILLNNTGPKDICIASFNLGGNMKLVAGSGDFVKVTIRDDLTSVKLHYLTATLYGVKE
jgi:hypothetical protein